MAQKNATPTKAQKTAIEKAGLNPKFWTVKKVLPSSLIVIHRITGEVKLIDQAR